MLKKFILLIPMKSKIMYIIIVLCALVSSVINAKLLELLTLISKETFKDIILYTTLVISLDFIINILIKISELITYNSLYMKLYISIMNMKYKNFIDLSSGEYINSLQSTENISTNFIYIFMIIKSIATLISSSIMISKYNSKLLICILVFILLSSLSLYLFSNKINKLHKLIFEKRNIKFSFIDDSINGFELIKSDSLESKMIDNMDKILNDEYIIRKNSRTLSTIMDSSIGLMYELFNFILIAISLSLNNINIVAIILLFERVYGPIYNIIINLDSINKISVEIQKYISFIEFEKEELNDKHINDVSFESLNIKDLSFSYNGDLNVLNNISLNIEKGQHIGFVGASGCGKSTLFKLICGLYDNYNGTIFINNIDIKNMSKTDLRNKISYVSQNCPILNDTILKNIQLGNDKDRNDIIDICKKLNLHDFIMSTENGYDTIVGHNGIKLSGGQKQRISIARALLSDKEILLLDEATSALDNITEKLIQNVIDKTNKTVISIAHRLSTLENYDKILVFSKDGIVESGTHIELLSNKNLYYKLYNKGI